MKKTMKATAAILAAIVLFCLSLNVFALEAGVITITGDQLSGKTVTAVRMFTASWIDNTADANNTGKIDDQDTIAYVLEAAWEDFFNNDPYFAYDATQPAGSQGNAAWGTVTGADLSEKSFNYLSVLNNDDAELIRFADAAANYYRAHTAAFSSLKYEDTVPANTNTITISDIVPGYYLVLPKQGSTSVTRGTDAILVNVPSAQSVGLNLKSGYPTVEKTVEGGKETSASIGDTVTFTLTSAVPEMSDYTTYYFAFIDTLSAGLDYVTNSVAVSINNTPVDSADYTVSYNATTRVLTVEFTDLKTAPAGVAAGQSIVVTYDASLNENAVVGDPGNPNNAVVEYQNGPTTTDHGVSTPTDSTVYTYDIEIQKFHDSNIAANRLAGAVFSLKDSTDTIIPLVLVTAGDATNASVYRVATPAEIADSNVTKVTQITTPASGLLQIRGLEAGTYSLEEITAPTGYNKLSAPISIVIAPSVNNTGATPVYDYSHPTYQIGTGTASISNAIPVENNSGSILPSTGSIGTIGLTVFGIVLVIGGVMLTSKNKKQDKAGK